MAMRDPIPPSGNSYDDIDQILDQIIDGATDLKKRLGQLANRPADTIAERVAEIERQLVADESKVMDYLRDRIDGIEYLETLTVSLLVENPNHLHAIGELSWYLNPAAGLELTQENIDYIERMIEIAGNIGRIASNMSGRTDSATIAWMKAQMDKGGILSSAETAAFSDAVDHFIRNPKIQKEVDLFFVGTFVQRYHIDMDDVNIITLKCLVREAAFKNSPEIAEQGVDEILRGFNINKADYSRIIRDIISLVWEGRE